MNEQDDGGGEGKDRNLSDSHKTSTPCTYAYKSSGCLGKVF